MVQRVRVHQLAKIFSLTFIFVGEGYIMKAKLTIMLVFIFTFVWFCYPAFAYNINELILNELEENGTRLIFVNTGILGDKGTRRLAKSHFGGPV